jgi:hypothetical protein
MLFIETEIYDEDINDLMTVLSKSTSLWAVSFSKKTKHVSRSLWETFLDQIHTCNLTHFFVEETIIGSRLKKKFVEQLRSNREKRIPDLDRRNARARGKGLW